MYNKSRRVYLHFTKPWIKLVPPPFALHHSNVAATLRSAQPEQQGINTLSKLYPIGNVPVEVLLLLLAKSDGQLLQLQCQRPLHVALDLCRAASTGSGTRVDNNPAPFRRPLTWMAGRHSVSV